MSSRKNKVIIAMIIAVLFMAIGYAAFQTRLTINGTGSITSKWKIEITNITSSITGKAYNVENPTFTATSANFNAGLKLPGDKIEYTVTVKNSGTVDAIIDSVNAEVEGSFAIVYSLSGIQAKTKLAAGASKSFKIIVEFDASATSIPSDTTKRIDMNIICIQDDGQSLTPSTPIVEGENTLTQRVLFNTPIQDDNGLHLFSPLAVSKSSNPVTRTISSSTYKFASSYTFDSKTGRYTLTGSTVSSTWSSMSSRYKTYPYTCFASYGDNCYSFYEIDSYVNSTTASVYNYATAEDSPRMYPVETGLYQTSTNTEGNKKTYYFRGNPTNNYVSFAEKIWRIVRINEDQSVRLIYQGTSANETTCLTGSQYNTVSGNAGIGYTYGNKDATDYMGTHLGTNESEMKQALDSWYEANLITYKDYLADSGFCNDRSLYGGVGYGNNQTLYGGYNRLENLQKPQFSCPQQDDLFTTSTSSKGNKKLKYPIGLISADEAVYAGMNYFTSDLVANNFNLYIGGCMHFTMTPAMTGDIYLAGAWINESGQYTTMQKYMTTALVVGSYRPVINLKSSVQVKSGNGTSSSPYVIG